MSRSATVLTLATFSIFTGVLHAQVEEAWSVPAIFAQSGTKIVVDASGRIAMAGEVTSPTSTTDVRVEVRDAAGVPAWSTTFDTLGLDRLIDLAADGGGNIVIAVSSFETVNLDLTGVVAKFDSNGTILWSRVIAPSFVPVRVTTSANGDVFVVGHDEAATPHIHVARYDSAGTHLWTSDTSGPGNVGATPSAVAVDASGAVVVCGAGDPSNPSGSDALVARIDAAGATSWVRVLSGWPTGYETARDVALDAAGNAYVVGQLWASSTDTQRFLWKVDAAGNTAWIDTMSGGNGLNVAVDPHGDVTMLGYVAIANAVASVLRKYDPAGNLMWDRTRANTTPADLALDGAGEAFVFAQDTAAIPSAPLLVRYDRNGLERWAFTRPTINESAASACVAGDDSVYLVIAGGLPGKLARLQPTVAQYCFGDGSGTACPCGNASPVGNRAGCANSFGTAARLVDAGTASLTNDSLSLHVSGVSNSFVTFFEGTNAPGGGAGVVFGDGLRCIAGSTVRVATRLAQNQSCTYPSGADVNLALQGQVTVPGTQLYQVIYRDNAPFCTSATFNFSGALRVKWVP